MKLYAPEYYKKFKCIADRCHHSCCIGWEIDIDDSTLETYSGLSDGYGKDIKESICEEGTPHFRLSENDRCPHLDEGGLCNIIKELGEGYLCCICREHPRFYNDTARGKEAGLGLSCEEACRLILSSDGYDRITALGSVEDDTASMGFDSLPLRERIFSVLSDRVPYVERLERIYEDFTVSPDRLSDGEWAKVIEDLEYLDETHRELFSVYTSDTETPREYEDQLERALAYFIYRHVTPAEDEGELCASLGLCLFLERLLCSVMKKRPSADIFEAARIISEEIEYSEDNTEAVKFEFWV